MKKLFCLTLVSTILMLTSVNILAGNDNIIRIDSRSNINNIIATYGSQYKNIMKSDPNKAYTILTGGSVHCTGYKDPTNNLLEYENALVTANKQTATTTLTCNFKNIRVIISNRGRRQVKKLEGFSHGFSHVELSKIKFYKFDHHLSMFRSGQMKFKIVHGVITQIISNNILAKNIYTQGWVNIAKVKHAVFTLPVNGSKSR